MRIAISGAHRCGKTTLASRLVDFVAGTKIEPSDISHAPVWKEAGISPPESMTFAERVIVQKSLLEYLESKYEEFSRRSPGGWITDRSPYDVVAYLGTNIDETCSNLHGNALHELLKRAHEITKKHLDYTFIIQPGIDICREDGKNGKKYSSQSYIEALNIFIQGSAWDQKGIHVMPRSITLLNMRIDYCVSTILRSRYE